MLAIKVIGTITEFSNKCLKIGTKNHSLVEPRNMSHILSNLKIILSEFLEEPRDLSFSLNDDGKRILQQGNTDRITPCYE